ncbi:endoribonuclease MazF [Candidimonas humi]|uniref:Endoribonuclease MazF n=1 Tax=Candidimonas humi TaxID=683355 RepID=A0ABV8NSX9_9BURK|nr:endoribonuclease MazF [Candidimonas humi]MBV6303826.1 endoribonuclease MazF [Candidimonas humi]
MSKRYTPNAGDVIWLHFDVPRGAGVPDHKPAVVLSPLSYNKKTGLVVCCPVVAQAKGYPFEVALAKTEGGVALADQVKSLNWTSSKISHQGRIDSSELAEIRAKLHALIFKD